MTGMDIRIFEAGDGQEAIGIAESIRPDFVITDLNMPGMSGNELVARMHADPCLKATPVLVLSADRGPSRISALLGSGAVAYLTKPASPELLRRTLVAALEGRQ
jgi:CheY-like chemotaxis protein